MRTVLRPRKSSAWTITAKRPPRCSRPRALRGAGRRKTSPRTISVGGPRRELRELFPDDPHLLAIALVRREAADLVTNRRARPSPGAGLVERGAHGFGVGQALRTNDVESRLRAVVKADVKGTRHSRTVARRMLHAAASVRIRAGRALRAAGPDPA